MGASGVNHNWTAAEDALLGTIPDGEIARRIGLTPLSVLDPKARPLAQVTRANMERDLASVRAILNEIESHFF
jgi:hypothetical protein